MEAGFITLMVVVAVVTFILGVMFGFCLSKPKRGSTETCGIVHIDCSDIQHDPWMYLEARIPVEEITSQKQVTFDVNVIR